MSADELSYLDQIGSNGKVVVPLPAHGWQALNLAAPEFDTRPEPPSLCGLIYTGRRHLVSGPPEAAKTLFTLIAGLELIRAGGKFAMVDFESGPYAVRLMLDELGATAEEISCVHYVEAAQPPNAQDVEDIVSFGATLAIIDAAAGAYGVSGLDDNQRKDAEQFGATWIDPLWRKGVTTLTVDHVVKQADNRGRFAIGSERKAGRTDVHLGLEAATQISRGRSGVIKVTTHKDRPGWLPRPRAAELHLHSDADTHQLSWEFKPAKPSSDDNVVAGDGWRPTVLMDRVLEHFSHNPEPITRSELANSVRGTRQYLLQAIDFLVEDGRLTRDGKRLTITP